MDRRTFVTGVAGTFAVTAGCLASGGGAPTDDPTEEPTDEPTDTPNGDPTDTPNGDPDHEPHSYAVVEGEPIDGSPLRYEVDVLDDQLHSTDSPLRVEVTLTNATDETIRYGERRTALFWSARSDDGFTLLPEPDSGEPAPFYEFDEGSEYWVATEPFVTTSDYQIGELEPGKSHTETLVLLVAHEEEPPTDPPDEIPFATEFDVTDDEGRGPVEPSSEWGFTLARDADDGGYVARGEETVNEFPLRYAADLTQADLRSPDEPVQVEVSLTNESDVPVTYGERRTALFWNAQSGAFVLYPMREDVGEFYERDADSGVWVATDGFGMTMDYQLETLEPGGSRTETFVLLLRPDAEEAVEGDPPGELSFETTVTIDEIDGEPVESVSAEWGFTLENLPE